MFPILSAIVFGPLAGVLLILVIPREDKRTIRIIGNVFALVTLVLAIIIWVNVAQEDPGKVWYETYEGNEQALPWIEAFDVYYRLGVDGLSAPMVFLTALMTTLALWYSTRTIEMRVKEYFLLFLLLETSLLGVFLAHDLVMFYIFWVVGMLPMLLLISIWGGERREHAAIKFFLYNLLGSVAMLLAILAVYTQVSTFNVLEAAQKGPYADAGRFTEACFTFGAFFVAFAIRLPSFPFHTWLPDAQTEAPTAGSAALAGVFLSTGGYGLIRVALPLFPGPFSHFVANWIIPVLAVMSIVYGALVCMAQWDLKRLLSYISVVQMGFVTLGVCAAAAAYEFLDDVVALDMAHKAAASGLSGAAMQLFAHGIISGALFFLVGILYERTYTYDLRVFGGFAKQIPHYYGLMLVAGFAALGLPGLIGFWGEFFVFKGTMATMQGFAFVGVLGMIFTAGYTLWKIMQRIFLGTLDQERWGLLPDMTGWEKVTVWPLVLIMVILGFYPTPVLDMLNAAVDALLKALL
jgi:NADH-quinone oxidoreductase subunit M